MSRIIVALLWLLHWLPLSAQAPVGVGLGELFYRIAWRRRHIVRVNLRLCFPEKTEAAREVLARRHFHALGRSFTERGLLWWASRERLEKMIRFEGLEKLQSLYDAKKPVILLAPHFVGLDTGGAAVAMRFDCASIYARQKDKTIDHWLYHGRSRFGDQLLLSRQDGVRHTVKAIKAGRPLYYLPDMDYGRKDAIFVPFFGVPAATITALPRLAQLTHASVLPYVTRILPGGAGYVVEIGEPWADYPCGDIEADTRRMNEWIEEKVKTMPEQYYWVHRRFKTRPEGEPRPY